MDTLNLDRLRLRFSELHDDALLREGLRHAGDLVVAAQEVLASTLLERFGRYADLVAREAARAGSLWGRIHHALGFARLRAPGEPMLGGRDVPPYDGILFLATGGFGFLPTSASPEETFLDFDAAALTGPVATWLGPEGTASPATAGAPRALPIPLRARLDDATAWIDRAALDRVVPGKRELRVRVTRGGDAVFRLEEREQREVLERWAAHLEIPFGEG